MQRTIPLLLFLCLFTWASFAQPGQVLERTFMKDDSLRRYLVYVPSSYTGDEPYPVVYNIPGNANFADFNMFFIRLQEIAEAENFLYVVPEATVIVNPPFGVAPSWNVLDDPNRPDDFAYLEEVLLRVASEFAVDSRRVYTSGHSQGAIMNYLMICRMSEHFAAFGPVSGRLFNANLEACLAELTETRPIALIYGDADPILPFGEVTIPGLGTFSSVPDHTDVWRMANGCSESTLETDLPDINTGDGSTVTLIQYQDCDEGKDVWFYRVNGGGHYWPGATDLPGIPFGNNNKDIRGGQVLWDFFEQFELEAPPFELLNAQRNGSMGPLEDGDELMQEIMPLKLNIQVNPEMEEVDRMALELSGPMAYSNTERNAPFTLFGNRGSSLNGKFLPQGDYTLSATPYSGGEALEPMVLHFSVSGPQPTLSSITVIDAETDTEWGMLSEGDVLSPGGSLNFMALAEGMGIKSVWLNLEGPVSYQNMENKAPFTLFGNAGTNYAGMELWPGEYTLTAIPFPRRNGFGEAGEALVINFTVGETDLLVREEPGFQPASVWNAFPNPSSGNITVRLMDLQPDEKLNFWLSDMTGRKVSEVFQAVPGQVEFQLERNKMRLTPGTYLLHGESPVRKMEPLKLVWVK